MKIMREVERKLAAAALARDPELGRLYETHQLTLDDLNELGDPVPTAAFRGVPSSPGAGSAGGGRLGGGTGTLRAGHSPAAPDRTELLVNQGRGSAYHP